MSGIDKRRGGQQSKRRKQAPERDPFHVRFSVEERAQLERVANGLGVSPSMAIRFLINAQDQRDGGDLSRETRLKYAVFLGE